MLHSFYEFMHLLYLFLVAVLCKKKNPFCLPFLFTIFQLKLGGVVMVETPQWTSQLPGRDRL